MAMASFSTAECFISEGCRLLEKKATGLLDWFKTAAIAKSLASVSRVNGRVTSMVLMIEFCISFFRVLKASKASLVIGKEVV